MTRRLLGGRTPNVNKRWPSFGPRKDYNDKLGNLNPRAGWSLPASPSVPAPRPRPLSTPKPRAGDSWLACWCAQGHPESPPTALREHAEQRIRPESARSAHSRRVPSRWCVRRDFRPRPETGRGSCPPEGEGCVDDLTPGSWQRRSCGAGRVTVVTY
jgi:hypothetical protein